MAISKVPTIKESPPRLGAEVLNDDPVRLLENGARMDQPAFHAAYLKTPEGFRAELIGGMVFVASPTRKPHMRSCSVAGYWLTSYEVGTAGTEVLADGTVILGPEGEPEPDAILRILPECGGRTKEVNGYLTGAPELVMEVALSSISIDLHLKKRDYEIAGVDEYVVALLAQRKVYWFARENGVFREIPRDGDGLLRSRRFPGLWLNPEALLNGNLVQLQETLQLGFASDAHREWVAELAAKRRASGE